MVARIVAFYAAIWNLECQIDVQPWSAFPLLCGIEGLGVDELAMSTVGALLSHSLQQGKSRGWERRCVVG